jgi:hypothetical protein
MSCCVAVLVPVGVVGVSSSPFFTPHSSLSPLTLHSLHSLYFSLSSPSSPYLLSYPLSSVAIFLPPSTPSQVHIVEVMDLVGLNDSGLSDPVVHVEVMGQMQQTKVWL